MATPVVNIDTMPMPGPFYAGSTLRVTCSVVSQSNDETPLASIAKDGLLIQSMDNNVHIGVLRSVLLVPLSSMQDSGNYTCIGQSTPNPATDEIASSDERNATFALTVSGENCLNLFKTYLLYIQIAFPSLAPTPIASLNSTSERFPDTATVYLLCTATLPIQQNELTASFQFQWFKGTQDITSFSTSSGLTSTLVRMEPVAGSYTYTCRSSVIVAGDPPYSAEDSASITVTGTYKTSLLFA